MADKTMTTLTPEQAQELYETGVFPEGPVRIEPEIPEGAEVIKTRAGGEPFSYKAPDGTEYFAPGSTPYEMGHRTEQQRLASQGGSGFGPYEGSLVPENSIVVFDKLGIPQERFTIDSLGKTVDPSALESYINNDRYRIAVNTYQGEKLITQTQADNIAKAATDSERLELYKDYGLVPEKTTLRQFLTSPETLKKEQSAAEFTATKQAQRFERMNTRLPDNQYISNTDLMEIKKESPEVYQVLTTEGFDAANRYIDNYNKSVEDYNKAIQETRQILSGDTKGKDKESVIKTIFRALTPWDEGAGETFLEYMKGYPGRVGETVKGKFVSQPIPSQEELKKEYEENMAAPMWAKVLFGDQSVYYDKKTDTYFPLVIGVIEATPAGASKAAVAKQASKAAEKAVQVLTKEKPKIDWNWVKDSIKNAKFKSAADAVKAAQKVKTEKLINGAIKSIGKKKATNDLAAAIKASRKAYIPANRYNRIAYSQIAKNRAAIKIAAAKRRAVAARVAAQEAENVRRIQAARQNMTAILIPQKPKISLEQLQDIKIATDAETVDKYGRLQAEFVSIQAKTKPSQKEQRKAVTLLQRQTSLLNRMQNEFENAVQEKTELATELAMALKTDTKLSQKSITLLENALKIKPVEKVELKTETVTTTAAKPAIESRLEKIRKGVPEKQAVKEKVIPLKPKLKISDSAYQKRAREIVRKAKISIGWRQGELHGKDRYDVITEPFTENQQYLIIMGKRPTGMTFYAKNARSAIKTAVKLTGKEKTFAGGIIDQPGLFTVKVTPGQGERINISFVKDSQISEGTGKISNSGKFFPLPR